MLELPKNSSYYLDKSKATADAGDKVSALEILQLAFKYAETDTEVMDCYLEKMELLEELKMETQYNYYDILARAGDCPEVWMRLFNTAMFEGNMPVADYYLTKISEEEGDTELELVGAEEDGGVFEGDALEAIGKMMKAHRERNKIEFVNSSEEQVKKIIDSVLGDHIVKGDFHGAVKKLIDGLGICEEYDSEMGNLAVNCAVMTGENEFAYDTFKSVLTKLPGDIPSLCNSYSYAAATENEELRKSFLDQLHAALPNINIGDTRTVLLAAYTLNESGDYEGAYDLVDRANVSDLLGLRLKATILLNLDRDEEALAILRHLELCGSWEDKLLRSYYNAHGKDYAKIGNNILNVMSMHYEKLFINVSLSRSFLDRVIKQQFIKDAFLYMLNISSDKIIAAGENRKEMEMRYQKLSEAFVRAYPDEVLPVLYNDNVYEMLRRNMLYYFILELPEAEKQRVIQTFSPDRKITVETHGFIYRSDILMDKRWDEYPDKFKAAFASAIADCCFDREIKMDELSDAAATLKERMDTKALSIYSFRMIYTAAVAILNPDMDVIADIVGCSDSSVKYIKRVCKKLDIEIFDSDE